MNGSNDHPAQPSPANAQPPSNRAAWLTFGILMIASAGPCAILVLAGWTIPAILLTPAFGLAMAWVGLIVIQRERGGQATPPKSLYLLWPVALGRVWAIGLVWLLLVIGGLAVSGVFLYLISYLSNLGAADGAGPAPTHDLLDYLSLPAQTVLPLALSGWYGWKVLRPLALDSWRDDLAGRTVRF